MQVIYHFLVMAVTNQIKGQSFELLHYKLYKIIGETTTLSIFVVYIITHNSH